MFRLEGKLGEDVFIIIALANLLVAVFVLYIRQSVLAIRPVLFHYKQVIIRVRQLIYTDGNAMNEFLNVQNSPEASINPATKNI